MSTCRLQPLYSDGQEASHIHHVPNVPLVLLSKYVSLIIFLTSIEGSFIPLFAQVDSGRKVTISDYFIFLIFHIQSNCWIYFLLMESEFMFSLVSPPL